MSMEKINKLLIVGGLLSLIAALLHIAIIIGGGDMYRTFGAGEALAAMDEAGSLYPALLTSGIAFILFMWALYAFSGAGLIRRLPLLKPALVVISVIYLIRGFALIPIWLVHPELLNNFVILSSMVCLGYGFCYALGTKQIWRIR